MEVGSARTVYFSNGIDGFSLGIPWVEVFLV